MVDIPTTLPQEIINKYTEKDNTFTQEVKSNPKDRIEVEIGDSKQPDFKPQVKIKHRGGFSKGNVPWNKGKDGYSTSWKGRKHSSETKSKMRVAKLGRVLSEETRRKISVALKGRMPKNINQLDNSGANSHWWKGGITPENEQQRKTKEFRNWRKYVYNRDNYTCQKCEKNTRDLHPHHILNFSQNKELRFEFENGITFCASCHRRFHSIYGMMDNNKKQLKEYLCL